MSNRQFAVVTLKTKTLRCGVLIATAAVLIVATQAASAPSKPHHPEFHGKGAHLNVGPRFQAGRKKPHPGPHAQGKPHAKPHPHPQPKPHPKPRPEPHKRHPPPPDKHHHGEHHHKHPYYWPGGYWGGVATGAAIGAMISALPPNCVTVVIERITYERCDGRWFRPTYSGNQVVYEVVAPPR